MTDARREAAKLCARPFDGHRVGASGPATCPRSRREVGEPDFAGRRERVVPRKHQAQAIVEQMLAVEGRRDDRWAFVFVCEYKVEAAEQQRRQGLFGISLEDLDLQSRVLRREPFEGRRQQREPGRLESADAQPATDDGAPGGKVGLGGVDRGEDAVGVRCESPPGVGQAHAATDLLKQRNPYFLLEPGKLLRHGLAVAIGLAFSATNILLGLLVRDPESAGLAGIFPVVILVFTSSTLVPVATMPGWLQAVAKVNPITVTVDALRALCLGGPTARPLVEATAWIAGILAFTIPLAVARYRRTAAI
jgi:hypothetical protein